MKVKYVNYFLFIMLLCMIVALLFQENEYRRKDRFVWNARIILDEDNEPIKMLEGNFIAGPSTFNILNYNLQTNLYCHDTFLNYSDDFQKQLPPDSISLKWFSYTENAFYTLKNKISSDKILGFVKKNKLENYELVLKLQKQGVVDLYVKDRYRSIKDSLCVNRYQGVKYNAKWEIGEDRSSDVFLMNSRVAMIPEINVISQSKFRKADSRYFNVSEVAFDSISKKILFSKAQLKKGPLDNICIYLENKSKYKNELLQVYVSYSSKELAKILNQVSKEKVYLSIQMDAQDSVKTVSIKDMKHSIPFQKVKVEYEMVFDHESERTN